MGVAALRSVIVMMLGTQLSMHMGAKLFRHLLQLPLAYFEKRHLGDVLSRFRSLDKVKELLTAGVAESLVDGVMAGILIAHRPETIRSADRVLLLTPSGLADAQAVQRVAEPA